MTSLTSSRLGALVMQLSKQKIMGYRNLWQRFHIDLPLLLGILMLTFAGLLILFSAANQNFHMVEKQLLRLALATVVMLVFAQVPPRIYYKYTPWIYTAGITMLLTVLAIGVISKGAQRWLNLGLFRFQPSEIMKIAVPMMIAYYFKDRHLPPKFAHIIAASALILLPTFLIAKQPDLGTSLIILTSGVCVLLLAGLNWRLLVGVITLCIASTPVVWHFMHDYQRQRVLTFLKPERDPLGTGYHIIQSKIAIGSGGIFGKGWLHGTQSHLNFLPAHATDFIFAVCGEEFGLIGGIVLLMIYLYIVARCLYISSQAQDTYTRLLAGSLSLTFFVSFFVNIGMVTGILPVVGLPLPLISYGGTSIVTLFATFGMLMAIHTHRNLHTT